MSGKIFVMDCTPVTGLDIFLFGSEPQVFRDLMHDFMARRMEFCIQTTRPFGTCCMYRCVIPTEFLQASLPCHVPAYLPAYLQAYLHTYPLSHVSTYTPIYLSTCPPACLLVNQPTNPPTCVANHGASLRRFCTRSTAFSSTAGSTCTSRLGSPSFSRWTLDALPTDSPHYDPPTFLIIIH
eukprot:4340999-Pleurochrysis_carterae.AAC.2